MNIFKEQKGVNEHPKRNNFDLSKKSNVTMKMGGLYPVYCKRVVPGDSFSIDTAFNLKLKPVVFPVQTKIRAHMHYFYVRNKNIWENWENWISNLTTQSEHPHPYINLPDNVFKNGSIHDFLGVPTSVFSHSPVNLLSPFYTPNLLRDGVVPIYYITSYSAGTKFVEHFVTTETSSQSLAFVFNRKQLSNYFSISSFESGFKSYIRTFLSSAVKVSFAAGYSIDEAERVDNVAYDDIRLSEDGDSIIFSDDVLNKINSLLDTYGVVLLATQSNSDIEAFLPFMPIDSTSYSLSYSVVQSGVYPYDQLELNYYTNVQHLNALPYRAYESIYYAYYNNGTLNPLMIGGNPQYNRYNHNLGDGADTTPYHIFRRNYELDFLTSCLPSPQQGVAPLVGLTSLGGITIEDENGVTTCSAEYDSDGNTTGVVVTSPAASVEHARMAFNLANVGMNIHDFRNSNALLRLLETNYRKGTKYEDFIAGHFGKAPKYSTLDMPEFIGGFSRDVNVSTVVSNADTLSNDPSNSGAALGEYGGYAQLVGGSKSSIRHYCDDHGWIIGIMSVVPTPCYSQLLNKQMLAPDNFLDYYFPEFSTVGMQPITYREVAPIQSYIDSIVDPSKSVDDTFGYQRPNYDYVSDVDELHGEFRDSLKDFVINRIFDTRPELGQSFIEINPDDINDIFVDTNSGDDTIMGEIGFAVHAKRPIPRVVIPSLGR